MSNHLVVVGGGQAGFSLISKLRSLGDTRSISLVTAEKYPPYQRPPLSKKYLIGEMPSERLLLRPTKWYDDQSVSLYLQNKVSSFDVQNKSLLLASGRSISYSNLALTTGSEAIRLPDSLGGNLDGVHTLRNIDDVDNIAVQLKSATSVLVIGGGYIGLEVAAVMSTLGHDVTIIEREERILKRVAATTTSEYFERLHKRNGVKILASTSLVELLEKEGGVCGARFDNGSEIKTDLVICGIGIRPNQQLALDAGLTVNDGIVVTESCLTSDPNIVAAGDCARFPYCRNLIRLESVQNSIDQAEVAAATLFGRKMAYRPYPWFWSDQFDVKLQIAGLNVGFNRTVTRLGNRPGSESTWYFKDEKLLAVDAINDGRTFLIAKKLLENKNNPEMSRLEDSSFDIKTLL